MSRGSSLPTKWHTFTNEVMLVHRSRGLGPALQHGFRKVGRLIWAVVHDAGDSLHDRWTGYDTTSQRFASAPKVKFDDAVGYEKTSRRNFLSQLHNANIRVPSEYTFIDLGCGKGNVLLLAAQSGFRSIIGVEVDPVLASIARRNLERFASGRHLASDPQVLESDAVQFEFPPSRSVLYLYNPFGEDTMRAVVQNLENSLARVPREIVVIYYGPVCKSVFDESAAFVPSPNGSERCAIYTAG